MENPIATEAAIEHRLAEMRRLREQMAGDQNNIDRLRVETKMRLAELQRV